MGNICSKSANQDNNFSTPGRTLGASSDAPPPRPVVAQPPKQKLTSSTPGRTLGSAGGDGSSSPDNARSAAARAAEERAAALSNKSGGKLASNLAAQKKQTQNKTLNAGSEQERMARTADANAETRNWN